MKKKIISLILIITLISSNSLSVYAEQKNRSAIAISSATATAILTLSTYAGIQFHDSNSFDEFLRRMCGLEQSTEFLISVTSLVGKSVDGTIKFTKEIISDFTDMLNRISTMKEVSYKEDSKGHNLPILSNVGTTSEARVNFLKAYPSTVSSSSTGSNSKTVSYGGKTITVSSNTAGYRAKCNSTDVSNSPCFYSSSYGTSYTGMGNVTVIGVYQKGSSLYFAHLSCMVSDTGKTWSTPVLTYCDSHPLEGGFVERTLNTTIGDSWTSGKGSIESNDSSEGVSLQIPSSMDSLLDKSPSDVSTPTYDVWIPGKDVSIPDIDNPAIEYVPDKSTDVPGDDTTTGNPGFPNFGDIPKVNLDLTPLRNGLGKLTERFPFSLPWDLQRIAQSFGGQPNALAIGQAPVVNMNFNGHELVLDFAKFEPIAMILRGFIFTEVAIGLIFVLRKLKP